MYKVTRLQEMSARALEAEKSLAELSERLEAAEAELKAAKGVLNSGSPASEKLSKLGALLGPKHDQNGQEAPAQEGQAEDGALGLGLSPEALAALELARGKVLESISKHLGPLPVAPAQSAVAQVTVHPTEEELLKMARDLHGANKRQLRSCVNAQNELLDFLISLSKAIFQTSDGLANEAMNQFRTGLGMTREPDAPPDKLTKRDYLWKLAEECIKTHGTVTCNTMKTTECCVRSVINMMTGTMRADIDEYDQIQAGPLHIMEQLIMIPADEPVPN